MRWDFSGVRSVHEYESVPPGRYACEIVDVREYRCEDGSARWSLRWNVLAGDWAGRVAAWDSLIFSERGLPRVKFVLGCLGFDVSGELTLERTELLGARAWVTVQREEFTHPGSGEIRSANKVPFTGYERWESESPEQIAPF